MIGVASISPHPGRAQGDPGAGDSNTVVVTGTRLARAGEDNSSPTQSVDPEAFTLTGVPNVEQTLNQLPQLVAGFTNTSNNPGTGAATLDLRGLGSVRTLILVNGRRWIASDAGDVPEVDVNTIPAALIERVDIVTGGASAVYGSDAVTGVINFILRDGLEGVRIEARQNVTGRGDGRVTAADLSLGLAFLGGRGHVVAAAGWLDQAALLQGARLLSRNSLTEGCGVPGTRDETGASVAVNDPACAPPNELALIAGGSAAIPGSRIVGAAFFPVPGSSRLTRNAGGVRFDRDGTPLPFVTATDLYNFGPENYLQVPFRRWSGNLLASLDLSPAFEPYVELSYVRTESARQLAPVPAVLGGGAGTVPVARINLANPFLTAAAARVLDLSYGVDALGRRGFTGSNATGFEVNPAFAGDADGIIVLPILIQSRLDLGPRQVTNSRDAWRVLVGLRGGLGGNWDYDLYLSHSRVEHQTAYRNSGSALRLQQALLAVRDPQTGAPVCLDPANGCVPANIFGSGNLSAEAAAFLHTDPSDLTVVEETIGEAVARGSFPLLPAGPLDLAFGISGRRTAYRFAPDPALLTGDDLGFQPGVPAAGSTRVWEMFAEARLPLLSGRRFAEELTAELGMRWSDYQTVGAVLTWKTMAQWSPFPGLRFRGGLQRAVRAPNIRELFEAPVSAMGGGLDPCTLPELVALPQIATACVRNGVPAASLGEDLSSSPVITSRGDPGLAAETARTLTIGAVARLRGPLDLTLTVDFFRIRIDRAIGTLGGGPGMVILECIARGADPADPLCQAYRRAPDGAVISIEAPTANMRSVFARGIDWQLAWRLDLGGPDHRLDLRLAGTRYLSSGFQSFEGVPAIDCAGHFGGGCGNTIGGTAVPEWKLYNSLAWTNGPATIAVRHRWFSATRDYREQVRTAFGLPEIALPEEGRRLESRHYFDVAASLMLNDRFTLTLGVNNLTDRPPAITGNGVQANTDPSLYDVLGRRFFAALNVALR